MSAGSLRETVADGPPRVATAPLDQLSVRCLRYGPSLPSARILQRRHGRSRCGNKKAPTVSEANSGTDKLLSFRSRPRFPFAPAVRAASQHSALGGPPNASNVPISEVIQMPKTTAKLEIQPNTDDGEQFQRFLEGARKRRLDESLEDFAVKFFQDRPPPKAL